MQRIIICILSVLYLKYYSIAKEYVNFNVPNDITYSLVCINTYQPHSSFFLSVVFAQKYFLIKKRICIRLHMSIRYAYEYFLSV